MNQSADIRAMLNDFGVSATLTDMSASTSTTVSGYSFSDSSLVIFFEIIHFIKMVICGGGLVFPYVITIVC